VNGARKQHTNIILHDTRASAIIGEVCLFVNLDRFFLFAMGMGGLLAIEYINIGFIVFFTQITTIDRCNNTIVQQQKR
jgi:hypothetical protein